MKFLKTSGVMISVYFVPLLKNLLSKETSTWEKIPTSLRTSQELSTYSQFLSVFATVHENHLIFVPELPSPNFFDFLVFTIGNFFFIIMLKKSR